MDINRSTVEIEKNSLRSGGETMVLIYWLVHLIKSCLEIVIFKW